MLVKRPDRGDRRRRPGADPRGARRHLGLPAGRAGDPRHRRRAGEGLDGLDRRRRGSYDVVPLFARLSAAEQHKVFAPHTGRRVVLATNVAETSLTVPGIRYVVDSGYARISRYSYRTKVQRLPIEAISQASANQRSGRCGRVEAGIAIRLYSEEDFDGPPGVHRPRDPAHQPRLGDPADDRAGARRRRPLPVRRPARPAQRQGRRPAARGAGSAGDAERAAARPAPSGSAHAHRASAGRAAGRPAAGPDGAGGGPAGLPARRARASPPRCRSRTRASGRSRPGRTPTSCTRASATRPRTS